MKIILKIEYIALTIFFSYLLIGYLNYNYLIFIVIFFLPDLGILGYLINNKIGAYTYNLLHIQTVGVIFLLLGMIIDINILLIIGSLMLAHSFFDRIFGYGLKRTDDFKHTHLGNL